MRPYRADALDPNPEADLDTDNRQDDSAAGARSHQGLCDGCLRADDVQAVPLDPGFVP